MQHTDKINDTIRDAESASSLNTTANILDLGGELLASLDALQLTEESISERSEAGHDVATNEVLGLLEIALLGDLHLQLAGAEAQVEDSSGLYQLFYLVFKIRPRSLNCN